MKSLKQGLFYGFLVWALPFIFSILIFFLHQNERALFESLMTVFGVFTAVLFTILYFKDKEKSLVEGALLGVVWILISLALDYLFFIVGPVKMTVIDYVKDIGISYLSIPIITLGFTYLPKIKKEE